MSEEPLSADLGAAGGLLATVVHDLRNPLSTVRTNLDFVVREPRAADAPDALADAQSAVLELARALDLVVHLSRALMGEPAYDVCRGDVLSVLRAEVRLDEIDLVVQGSGPFDSDYGGIAGTLVLPLVEIAKSTPGVRLVRIEVSQTESHVLVTVLDDGLPLPADVARMALTPLGPRLLRDRASPRRGRYGGLFAVSAIAGSVGVALALGERDGFATAELSFPA